MAFNSISTLQKNRVYAPMILGLTIIIAIFLTRTAFTSYTEAKALLTTTESEVATVQAELDTLRANAEKISDPNSDLSKKVAKIAQDFNSSKIIEAIMINNFTIKNSAAMQNLAVSVKDIKLDKGTQEPNGLYRGTIDMTISANNPAVITGFLDYLTELKTFAFTLNDISLPLNIPGDWKMEEISVSVKLGLYYYP